ncbi:MAG: 4-(cytidine 5'-diphospho)-2-C-methyl-D-erythritol kinase [Lachnospiraceae bacterium]|nr:4-(cytidine 5'-diphospho)-2-C-methyl-D-erythritol kinase [Lachnospiraceae bacterium]
MEIKAYAKINLGLDITGRREDGYHELKTIMQQIDLYDVIRLHIEPEIGGNEEKGQILLSCNESLLPTDERNIAYKAARMLFDEFEITDSMLIEIEKNIPMSAGLAGGSTDAAAVLKGVNEYLGLGLSDEDLIERGVKIGADVPFCIMGGTAYAEGVGEKLMPLGVMPEDLTILLAVPDTRVSTKWAYTAYDKKLLAGEIKHPDTDQLRAAIEMEDFGCIPEFLGNVLEQVTIPEYPIVAKVKETMMRFGAAGALMSGSGPSVYGLYLNEEKAAIAFDILAGQGIVPEERIFLTGFHN